MESSSLFTFYGSLFPLVFPLSFGWSLVRSSTEDHPRRDRVWFQYRLLAKNTPPTEWIHPRLDTIPSLMLRTNGVTGYFSNTSSTQNVRFCSPLYDPDTLTMRRRTVTLPLWSPSVVEIGSVGYLRKPEGEFVTLFNASNPPQSSGGVLRDMANLSDYGKVKVTQRPQRQDKQDRRNSTGRRYSFGLRAKNKIAFLCAESATYTHIENLSAPELWFKDNADEILRSYAYSHPITKEDLFLGTRNIFGLD